jgi:hypothetical protein
LEETKIGRCSSAWAGAGKAIFNGSTYAAKIHQIFNNATKKRKKI